MTDRHLRATYNRHHPRAVAGVSQKTKEEDNG
jgi:hypothetical protein